MRKIIFTIFLISTIPLLSQNSWNDRHTFFQANNISTVFIADGVHNLDRNFTFNGLEAGLIWPASAPTRMTVGFSTGMWLAAKVGPQRELRAAGCFFVSYFSPGNIPVTGQVPPMSVCNDTAWKAYLVNLNDQSLFNGGNRTKTAGGRSYSFNYVSWASWPVFKGAPYTEINNIPGYQPSWNGDRPGVGNGSMARPEELCFMVYMDYTNCTGDIHPGYFEHPGLTLPMGVEVHQLSFSFDCPVLKDMYFIKYKLINRSSLNWDSSYFSVMNDVDLGNAFDDAGGCDSARNLSFGYNKSINDPVYGSNPPASGTRLLQGPLVYTGNNNDTARLPYDTLIGYKMLRVSGQFTFRSGGNPCFGSPANAVHAYNYMRGMDACGNQLINRVTGLPTTFWYSGNSCTQNGWIDSTAHDVRYLQNSGPFKMNTGDTQIVVEAYIVTRDGGNFSLNVCALQSLSDSALKYYYNDFQTCIPIGIQSISSEVPDRFALYQNYPNPFNPTTTIRFSIPPLEGARGRTVILIYDILGREVETLVSEELQPGTYEVDWNAENYPSGVYFYQLTSSGFTQTNKMVILK